MKEAAALGFRAHSGWVAAVAVSGTPVQPVVLERRRMVIADAAIPGSKQPFHAAERLHIQEGEAQIRRCRDSSQALARDAIGAMVERVAVQHRVSGGGILFGSGRPLPGLEAILRSHALIHTAEGEFFRDVLAAACEACGLRVERIKECEVWERAGKGWQQRIDQLGRSLGPPWTQDEKLASMAAWIVLEGVV